MSSLEKSIQLLNTLPDNEIEKVYSYIQFICSQNDTRKTSGMDENIEDILDNITGSVPDSGKTLDEYKTERINKHYETTSWYKCNPWFGF